MAFGAARWLTSDGVSFLLVATLAQACDSEPCNVPTEYLDTSALPPGETPFPDGRTAFEASAEVLCRYDPMGATSIGDSGVYEDIPNQFDYCSERCQGVQHDEFLHSCTVTADANGISQVACHVGQTCSD